MGHDDTYRMQSNRPTSRRRHRRLAPSLALSRAEVSPVVTRVPTTLLSLPTKILREAGMFELLAAEARIAELEAALEAARAEAFTDPLTGALNRRGFDKASRRELARARRRGVPLVLAHIDLDDFKGLNDTYGHQVGDQALVHLVSRLHQSMRPTDVLCRFGGEEFVLMLPETTLSAAAAVVARFQSEFSAQPIPGADCVVTFSAGVVAQADDESIEDSIRRADDATYVAKRAGKNCVITR